MWKNNCSWYEAYRVKIYNVFNKLDTNDLWCLLKILVKLDLTGFVMSFCLEILEERGELPIGYNKQLIASRWSGEADSEG